MTKAGTTIDATTFVDSKDSKAALDYPIFWR